MLAMFRLSFGHCRLSSCLRSWTSKRTLSVAPDSPLPETKDLSRNSADKGRSVTALLGVEKVYKPALQVNPSGVFKDLFSKDEENTEKPQKRPNRQAPKRYLSIDNQISVAETAEELLTVMNRYNLNVTHALKILSTLSDWTVQNKVQFSEFENDARFRKLCRLLGQENRGSDLTTVLNITGDDRALKMVEGMSLPQTVQILSSVASKRRRSPPLLRALCSRIANSTDLLGIKQAADVLYAITVLNFPDEVLLAKVADDVLSNLQETEKSSVIGSIVKSFGILRYKHTELLEGVSRWMLANKNSCRPQDLVALLLTLATVNHVPSEDSDALWALKEDEVTGPLAWLEVVWSLVVLQKCTVEQMASVLCEQFLNKLMTSSDGSSVAVRLKLQNVNAVAKLSVPHYSGSFLHEYKNMTDVPVTHSKEKRNLVSSVLETLGNLLPTDTFLKPGYNTEAGFIIDGECVVDSKCNPIPLDKTPSRDSHRVAILVWDYHDMCGGILSPTGVNLLAVRILQTQGYLVLTVPFTEFNPQEKLVQRVQYLEQKLKSLVHSCNR